MKNFKIGILGIALLAGSSVMACPTPVLSSFPALHGFYICSDNKELEQRMYVQESSDSFNITYTRNVDGFGGPGVIELQTLTKAKQDPATINDQFVGTVLNAVSYCQGNNQVVLEGDIQDPAVGNLHMIRNFQFSVNNVLTVTSTFKDQNGNLVGSMKELDCHD